MIFLRYIAVVDRKYIISHVLLRTFKITISGEKFYKKTVSNHKNFIKMNSQFPNMV